jgi:hypothetical protein
MSEKTASSTPGIVLAVVGALLIVVSIILSAVGFVNVDKGNYKDAKASIISSAVFGGLGLLGMIGALFLLKSEAGQAASMALLA